MSFKQLEYFVSVGETLNFTTAAKRCFVSQAAMTQQIKALETKLGIQLFIRDKHKVELTPAGHSYLTDARMILEQTDSAKKRALAASEGFSGNLRIGFIRGYEHETISKFLHSFHKTYPNLNLEFIRHNMSTLYEMVEDEDCDIVFNLSPYKRSYPQLNHKFLRSYPMKAVLYPGHPLSERPSVTYADLRHEDFIIMQPKDRSNDEAEEVLICYEKGGFIPNIIHREREVQTLLFMISVGLGIAILPEYCVRFFTPAENLCVIPLLTQDGSAETMDFELAWNSNNTNSGIDKLVEWTNRL